MRVTILGCGTSSGVPRIGEDWGQCDPDNPKNRRSRASILVESGETRVLVDTTPDLRAQCLANGISGFDAVIWTHDHADHCHGIDDLRQVFHLRRAPIMGYARAETLASLTTRFGYIFSGNAGYPAVVELSEMPDRFRIGDIEVSVSDMPHGPITSAGLVFDDGEHRAGYATDFSGMTDDMAALFGGLDLWVVDALREKAHPTHAHLAMTLDAIERCEPARSVLTHMDQSMDYDMLAANLPKGVEPSYDGQIVELRG